MTEGRNYKPEEVQILKQARLFRDLVAMEAWKELEKLLKANIETRKSILVTPLDQIGGIPSDTPFDVRAAKMEVIKGAVIGLNLAVQLPHATIAEAENIIKGSEPEGTTQ